MPKHTKHSDAGFWLPFPGAKQPDIERDSDAPFGACFEFSEKQPPKFYSVRSGKDLARAGNEEAIAAQTMATLVMRLANQLHSTMAVVPSLSAMIGEETKLFGSLAEKIDALEEAWLDYNAGRSFTDYNHFSYYQIIGSGPFALPILLEKVKEGSDLWFVALKAIAGSSADTPEMAGDPDAARDAWLAWGKLNDQWLPHTSATRPDLEDASEVPPRLGPPDRRLDDSE